MQGIVELEKTGAGRFMTEEFERIFREHYAFVHRTAYHILRNLDDADDALQTMFLRLLRTTSPPDLQKDPKAYLYRAAVNAALDLVRARKHVLYSETDAETLPDRSARFASKGEEEIQERLRYAIAELKPKAAEILILRHVHGYTDSEIAKLLGVSRGAVAVSLFRSRSRLKKSIRSYLRVKS